MACRCRSGCGRILTIGLGLTLAVLDGGIANVALPTIAREVQTSPANSIWVVNAYQLAVTISLLPLSSLGEIYGYRRIYQAGLVLFTIASLACALSSSLPTLIIARMLQGFGAAGIMSVNSALIRFIYPRRWLGRGVGLNATVGSIASALGPSVASAILAVAPWPWLFAVNVPLGILARVHRDARAAADAAVGQSGSTSSARCCRRWHLARCCSAFRSSAMATRWVHVAVELVDRRGVWISAGDPPTQPHRAAAAGGPVAHSAVRVVGRQFGLLVHRPVDRPGVDAVSVPAPVRAGSGDDRAADDAVAAGRRGDRAVRRPAGGSLSGRACWAAAAWR